MKQFSLLTAIGLAVLNLLGTGRAHGQTLNRGAFAYDQRNYRYRLLDQTRIPGRMLVRNPLAVADSVRLPFNGQSDSLGTSLGRWEGLMSNARFAAFDTLPGEHRLRALRTRCARARRNVVPLALLDFQYGRLKPYALDSGLIVQRPSDSMLLDGPSRRESPYLTEHLFAVAPLRVASYHAVVRFYFGADGILTNRTGPPSAYAANFDDGAGWRSLALGDTVAVTYAAIGWKAIRVRAVAGTDTLVARTNFRVVTYSSEPPGYSGWLTSNPADEQRLSLPSCYVPTYANRGCPS